MTLDCNFLFPPPNKILRLQWIMQNLFILSLGWRKCCDSLNLLVVHPIQHLLCWWCGNHAFHIDHKWFLECYILTNKFNDLQFLNHKFNYEICVCDMFEFIKKKLYCIYGNTLSLILDGFVIFYLLDFVIL
jgi:hypothetical protein